jgi:hypothetical protein
LEGESFDDSDADKDYEEEKDNSSSSSSEDTSDDENHTITAIKAPKKGKEVRVYMDPPVEKAEGDTDKDSGGQTFSIFIFIFFIFFSVCHAIFGHIHADIFIGCSSTSTVNINK